MARSEGRLKPGIWREGLEGYSAHEKLLYCVLLTEPTLTHAGTGACRVTKWARDASLTVAETEKAMQGLRAGDPRTAPVAMDEDTEEVLVRTIIRNDGVADQPYVLKSALASAMAVRSALLRWVLAQELRKLPAKKPDAVSPKTKRLIVYPDPHAAADILDPPGSNPPKIHRAPSEDPSETLSEPSLDPSVGRPFPNPSEREGGGGRGGGESHLGSHSSSDLSSSAFADEGRQSKPEPQREDVDRLVTRLRDRVAENEFKIPGGDLVPWRRQARLLLDRDKRDLDQALRLIDWATSHHFWHRNVRSMDKFRQQYDALLAQARQEQQQQRQRPASARRTTDDKRAAIPALVDEVLRNSGTSALRPDLRAISGGGQP